MYTPDSFDRWHNPDPHSLGEDYLAFLEKLSGPTWITLDGVDRSRQRAIVTLLHGNEPSGLKAVHEFLSSGETPRTNLGIFVASVVTAKHPPMFSHRYLPHERDFNRCFGSEPESSQERLAARFVETLAAYQPEAVIDTHNTSAHSEPFAVAVGHDLEIRQLAQLFTQKLVVMKRPLGTLVEQAIGCPVITVEFGGFMDPRADELARDTISTFIHAKQIFDREVEPLQMLMHPFRLEVDHRTRLHYSSSVQIESDITMINTIDQLNFRRVSPGTTMGWLNRRGLEPFRVEDHSGRDICGELFREHQGFIETRVEMTLFMATTDPFVAMNDCLLYLCPH